MNCEEQEELLPCPLCGSLPNLRMVAGTYVYVCHTDKDLIPIVNWRSSEKGARAVWNQWIRELYKIPLSKEPSYKEIAQQVAKLVEEKQAAYGDSFGKSGQVMRILYPEGIPSEKLDDALTVTRVLDKLFRIATDQDAFGESPWRDIAGYSLLAVERQEREKPVEIK